MSQDGNLQGVDDAFVERMGHVRALLRRRASEDAFTLLEWQRSPVGERGVGGWNVMIHVREDSSSSERATCTCVGHVHIDLGRCECGCSSPRTI